MRKQTTRNFVLALALLGFAPVPSTGLAQLGLASKLPGKRPASAAAQATSHPISTPGATSYTYTLLSFPGTLSTGAIGLNPGTTTSKIEIVGGYSAADGGAGFLAHVSGTKIVTEAYRVVNYPHGTMQAANDIDDSGQIVGEYQDSSSVTHGYELSDGQFTTLDVPFAGATYTVSAAIDNSGEIVGSWGDGGTTASFTLIGGTYASFEYPGASYTFAFDVNNDGDIVGTYVSPDSNGSQGFLLSGGTYTSIEVQGRLRPKSLQSTTPGSSSGVTAQPADARCRSGRDWC